MKHNRKIIYLAGFLFSIPVALTAYINSSFLENYINAYYVGILYVIASMTTIFGLLGMPQVLTKIGNRSVIFLFSLILFCSLVILAFGNKNSIVIPAFILYFISLNFIVASLDIFIEDFSKNSKIGGIRGIYLSITSLAWVVAQLISGSIITKGSFQGIYLLSALFMVLVYILFVLFLRDFKDPEYKRVSISRTIKLFIRNKHISKIYLINLILKFFYAWMIIYNQYLYFSNPSNKNANFLSLDSRSFVHSRWSSHHRHHERKLFFQSCNRRKCGYNQFLPQHLSSFFHHRSRSCYSCSFISSVV